MSLWHKGGFLERQGSIIVDSSCPISESWTFEVCSARLCLVWDWRTAATDCWVQGETSSWLCFLPLLEYFDMRNRPSSSELAGVHSALSTASGSCWAPNACISSWTRLSTAILRGIRLCCRDFMLMNRQLKLYVFPSTLYLREMHS